jgi:hypothetical protein
VTGAPNLIKNPGRVGSGIRRRQHGRGAQLDRSVRRHIHRGQVRRHWWLSHRDRHSKTGLLFRAKMGTVPHGTAKAVVNVEMSRAAGSYNDGYADNLSLTIVPKS